MYSVGENFYYEIDGEEYEYNIIGDMIIRGREYLIAEDEEHIKRVFVFDDMEETVVLIDDEDDQDELLEVWENEFYGTSSEVGLWDDDEYVGEDEYENEEELGFFDEEEEDELETFDSDDEDDNLYF